MASRVISAVLKFKDQNFSRGMRDANRQAGEFGRYMQAAQNKAENFGQRANDVFKGVGVAAGALASGAIAGLGVAVGQSILEMDSAFAKLQAKTGAAGADLANLESAAKETFSRGYGESLGEVTEAIARVSQNMHEIDPSQLADVTAQAMLLAQTTDSDINEVTRGAQNLMNAFGITAQEAFDLFAKGAQDGLNLSNDMFDQMSEFSAVAARSGYTAEELFGTMAKGAENSVYNLDRINNSILNFGDLTTDGNKATSDSFKLLSDSTQQMWEDMKAGKVTAKELSSTVIKELKAMDDQTKANEIGISMWGSAWIDNTPEVMYAMFETTDAMKDFEGATDKAAQAVEGSFGNRVKSAFRDLTTSIASLADSDSGKKALDTIATTAENLVPKIVTLAEKALQFAGVIANNWRPIAGVVAGATAAIVAFKVGMMAMSIVTTVVGFIKAFRTAMVAGTAAQWAMNVAMSANPIGLLIAGISALIGLGVALYMNWDKVKAKAIELWQKINENPFGALLLKLNPIVAVGKLIYDNFDKIKAAFDRFKNAIKNFKLPDWVTSIGSTISNAASKVGNFINGSHATGLNTVPFDGYVGELHRGEMIIPARQAQKVRAAGGDINNIDKLISGKGQAVPVATTTNQATAPTINMTVNANQLSYDDVVYRLSKDIKLALSNM